MTKQFLLLLLVVSTLPHNLLAQEFVEFIFDKDSSEIPVSTFETRAGNYIALGVISDKNTNVADGRGLVIEFDNNAIIKSRSFAKDSSSLTFYYGFQKNNDNYLIFGRLVDSVGSSNSAEHIYLCEMNPELDIIWEKYHEIPDGYAYLNLGDIIVDQWNHIVLFSALMIPPYSTDYLYLTKYDMDGNLLNSNFLPDYHASQYDDLIINPSGLGYQIIGDMNISPGFPKSLFEIDTSLNVTETITFIGGSNDIDLTTSAKWIDENRLIVSNIENVAPGAYHDLELILIDQDYNLIKDTVFFEPGRVYTPTYKGMDFIYEDLIWTCTFEDDILNWQSNHTFKVYLFDSELNVLGEKTFGGDSHWWFMHLRATTDGGCIITGMIREKEGTNPTECNIYILKVMPEDLITSTKNHIDDNAKFKVFPNPVKDKLIIKGANSDMQLTISSIDGRSLITKELSSSIENIINTSSLNSGIYFYELIDNNQTVKSGKLIKQ